MRGRRAARVVALAAALGAAGVVGYAICKQRELRAEWSYRRLRTLCEDMPLELEAFPAWDVLHRDSCWAHITAVLDLGGADHFFSRMATGDRLDLITGAFAVNSIQGNMFFHSETLNRLRDHYAERIAARSSAVLSPGSGEAGLVRQALKISRPIDIQRFPQGR